MFFFFLLFNIYIYLFYIFIIIKEVKIFKLDLQILFIIVGLLVYLAIPTDQNVLKLSNFIKPSTESPKNNRKREKKKKLFLFVREKAQKYWAILIPIFGLDLGRMRIFYTEGKFHWRALPNCSVHFLPPPDSMTPPLSLFLFKKVSLPTSLYCWRNMDANHGRHITIFQNLIS